MAQAYSVQDDYNRLKQFLGADRIVIDRIPLRSFFLESSVYGWFLPEDGRR